MSTLKAIAAAVKVATDAAAAALASLGVTNTARDTATTQAGIATTAAGTATTKAAAADASRAAIDNRIYPGTYAADPLTRPDASAIHDGDVCTLASGVMRVRIAGAWQDWTAASGAAAAASAAAAAGSAGAAAGSAGAAAGSAGTATAQAAAALAQRNAIDARIYPGTYAADPATRPDGSARVNGDIYFTTGSVPKTYNGGVWSIVVGPSAADLANSTDPTKGSALLGHRGVSAQARLDTLLYRTGLNATRGPRRRLPSGWVLRGNTRVPTFNLQALLPHQTVMRTPRNPVTQITWANIAGVHTANAKCPAPHNLKTGDRVVLYGATDSATFCAPSQSQNPNGYYLIPGQKTRGVTVTVVDEWNFTWVFQSGAFPLSPDSSTTVTWERACTYWDPYDPVFHYPAGREQLRRMGNQPSYWNSQAVTISPGYGGFGPMQYFPVEFYCDDPEFEFVSNQGTARVFVDGSPASRLVDVSTPSYPGYITRVTLPQGRGRRLIRLEFYAGRFLGVITPSQGGLQKIDNPPARKRFLLLGDSFGEGSGADQVYLSVAYLLAMRQGWELVNGSLGSTGVTTPGVYPGYAYTDRAKIYFAQGWNPEVIGILDSVNDGAVTTVPLATAFVNQLRASWPTAQIVVLGRVSNTENPGSSATSLAWKQVCDTMGLVYCDGGSGYFGGPVAINAANKTTYYSGVGATATATFAGGVVTGANITNAGDGYQPQQLWASGALPTVTLSGGGGGAGAVLTPVMNYAVGDVFVAKQGANYTQAGTTVSITSGASAIATISGGSLDSIGINSEGAGFVTAPPVTITGGGGAGATAHAELTDGRITNIVIDNPGAGYTSAPTVGIAIATTDATATPVVTGGKITGITITSPGSFYTAFPQVIITGDGDGAEAYAFLKGVVSSLTVTNGGAGYTAAPTIAISHPHPNGATDPTHPKDNGYELLHLIWGNSLDAAGVT